jgi:hypothetical protein
MQIETGGGPQIATLPAGMRADRLPDTPQGKRIAVFLDAFATATAPVLSAYFDQQTVPRPDRTTAERVKGLQDIHDRIGNLTFKKLAGVRDDEMDVVVESAVDGEIHLIVSFEPAPAHRITQINFQAGFR